MNRCRINVVGGIDDARDDLYKSSRGIWPIGARVEKAIEQQQAQIYLLESVVELDNTHLNGVNHVSLPYFITRLLDSTHSLDC